MGSCYIYQPQYLGAAQGKTNGLPIGDAITGSVGGRAGAEMGTWQVHYVGGAAGCSSSWSDHCLAHSSALRVLQTLPLPH